MTSRNLGAIRPLLGILACLMAATALSPVQAAKAETQPPEAALVSEKPSARVLGFTQALNLALEQSPILAASASRADAATESRSQAGALPNPEISVEAENIYGDGPYDGLDGAEVTYGVSQLVELPGKRSNRVGVADAENTKLHFGRDTARLDLIQNVTLAYAEAAAAQQEVAILEEAYTLATQVRDSVGAKVKAGKEPPIQNNKAEIERASSGIALDRARRSLAAKKQALASIMAETNTDFSVQLESLPTLVKPDTLDAYQTRLPMTPDVKALDASVVQARSQLSFEKANTVPDPTLNFGVRDFREDDSQAFVAGISFPLPVFNMNRAGVKRAGHELNAAMLDQQGTQLSMQAALTELHADYSSAYSEAETLRTAVLPGAEEAFRVAREGYDAGKFGYLEVLDAQRTLFEARKQLNVSVLDYHLKRAAIERMTAHHDDQTNQPKKDI